MHLFPTYCYIYYSTENFVQAAQSFCTVRQVPAFLGVTIVKVAGSESWRKGCPSHYAPLQIGTKVPFIWIIVIIQGTFCSNYSIAIWDSRDDVPFVFTIALTITWSPFSRWLAISGKYELQLVKFHIHIWLSDGSYSSGIFHCLYAGEDPNMRLPNYWLF